MLFASLLLGVFLSILLPLGSPFRFRPAGCAVHFVRKPHCGQRIHSKSSDSSISDQAVELHLGQVFPFDDFLQHYRQEARAICGVFALEAADSSILVAAFSDDVYRAVTKISLEGSLQGNLIHSIRVQTFPPSQQELMEKYTLELIRQTNPTFSSLDKIFPVLEQDSKSTASYGDVPTSPFATDGSSVGSEKVESVEVVENDIQPFQELEFTFANVDKVLDEVRPYLQADGGNVAVVEVDKEKRSVKLLLEGACGSCPSSTTTMKMGIERILKENFSHLGEVAAVDPSHAAILTVEKVSQNLEKVLPAIKGLGGSVEVVSVSASTGSVSIRFQGPERLKKGLELLIRDTPHVKDVVFL